MPVFYSGLYILNYVWMLRKLLISISIYLSHFVFVGFFLLCLFLSNYCLFNMFVCPENLKKFLMIIWFPFALLFCFFGFWGFSWKKSCFSWTEANCCIWVNLCSFPPIFFSDMIRVLKNGLCIVKSCYVLVYRPIRARLVFDTI